MSFEKHFADLRRRFTLGREHCGFITEHCLVEVNNAAVDPKNHFEISADDVELYLDTAIATWHSHTDTTANLSLEDYLLFRELPNCHHLIVSPDEIWVYYTNAQGVVLIEDRFNG